MIRTVRIKNYKSLPDLTLDLGRVTVLIGANGSGKSNILEAIALAAAASQFKLDHEFLFSRGIRTTENRFMHSAFAGLQGPRGDIEISAEAGEGKGYSCHLITDPSASVPMLEFNFAELGRRYLAEVERLLPNFRPDIDEDFPSAGAPDKSDPETEKRYLIMGEHLKHFLVRLRSGDQLAEFLIYAPENSALRTFQSEGQILPLGIRGEGLFAHLKALDTDKNRSPLAKIKERLSLIDWYETFDIPGDLSPGERTIRIHDRFLPETALFDQRSANEGFLYLLFYMTLLVSPDTPAFFAIDNVDSSLNPKLCIALLQQIVALAKEYDKQVILTTHNPAVLDGLDLHDDEQRLLIVERNKAGHTRVHRVEAPKVSAGQVPVALSEAFMRGYIGGLPKNF